MNDYFETELLECSVRGLSFPSTTWRTRIVQSIARHQRPDQDGSRVEATGRESLVFSTSIPFRTNLARGKNESWTALYPTTWRQFLKEMSDRSSGILQHPSLGRILVKPMSCESHLDSSRRDGEDVNAEWIEFSEDEDASNAILGAESPIGGAIGDAADLDSYLSQTNFGGFDPGSDEVSLEDAMRSVAAVVDTASLLSRQQYGIIDRVAYRIDSIEEAIRESGDPQNWPAKESCQRLRASLMALKAQALTSQKDVRIYITPAATSLSMVAKKFGNTMNDAIRLNPDLVSSLVIPEQTVVRYFGST